MVTYLTKSETKYCRNALYNPAETLKTWKMGKKSFIKNRKLHQQIAPIKKNAKFNNNFKLREVHSY